MTHTSTSHVMRLPAVMFATGLSRSSIYAFIQQKKFPPQIFLGIRAVGWKSEEVAAWLDQRAELRGAK